MAGRAAGNRSGQPCPPPEDLDRDLATAGAIRRGATRIKGCPVRLSRAKLSPDATARHHPVGLRPRAVGGNRGQRADASARAGGGAGRPARRRRAAADLRTRPGGADRRAAGPDLAAARGHRPSSVRRSTIPARRATPSRRRARSSARSTAAASPTGRGRCASGSGCISARRSPAISARRAARSSPPSATR